MWIASFSKKYSLLCLVSCAFSFAAPRCIESIDNTGNIPAGRYLRSINNNGQMPPHKKTCPKGHYLDATSGQCFPCPENTFISVDNHSNEHCMTCKANKFSHEIQTWSGNTTHSPEFGCDDGYYIEGRRHANLHCPNVECGNCKNCSALNLHEIRKCSKNSNAECTSKATNTTTPANTHSSTTCDRNFYLDKSNNTCQPCPLHTYMGEDNHTSNVCFNNSQVTGQDKINGNSSMQEPNHNTNSRICIVICSVIGIVVLICPVVVLIRLYKKGKWKAIMESFRRNPGSARNDSGREVPDSPETRGLTENESGSEVPDSPEIHGLTENESGREVPDSPETHGLTENESGSDVPDSPETHGLTENESGREVPDSPETHGLAENESRSEVPDSPETHGLTENESGREVPGYPETHGLTENGSIIFEW